MSAQPAPAPPFRGINVDTPLAGSDAASLSFWDRVSNWASDNKAVVYTIAGIVVVVSAAGTVYYLTDSNDRRAERRPSKKERRKAKKEKEEAQKAAAAEKSDTTAKQAKAEEVSDELPEVSEEIVAKLSEQERKDYAAKLKAAGNKKYIAKQYNDAIDLYSKALLCKQDAVFFSNRAACYNALKQWEKTVEDATAALALDNEYVKALNRRASAYENLEKYSEALLDYTASCIIDSFRNQQSAQSVERLLKVVAEIKAKDILAKKGKKLPSAVFVNNYVQSFRAKPTPQGLEEDAELDDESGKGQLRAGLLAMASRSSDGFEKASECFEKALEAGDLGEHESFAYNMRGTFRYLRGDTLEAIDDLTKSIELDPAYTQSYVKRASMNLEAGNKDGAENDFDLAIAQNEDDPDIYYHRAQLRFISGEYPEAAKNYQKSIELDREFIYSHIQLGVTQYKMGSIASSMATFRRCVKNFDRVPDVYNYYGELLLDQQKYEDAIEKFDTAVEMEKQSKPLAMNVLPLINKALALFQWKQDFTEAENLCQKALIIDEECDLAVATMAQLLLQQGKVVEALKYFEMAAELSRTEAEIVNALSYAEATRTQIQVQENYPKLASKLQQGLNYPMG